jgi:hypothetical protein
MSDDAEPQEPIESWDPPAPRLAPALIVVGIVAVIVIAGALLGLTGGSAQKASPTAHLRSLRGTSIGAQVANTFLSPIVSSDQPPPDVVDALYVPAGAKFTGFKDEDHGVSTYDRSVTLNVDDSVSAIVAFFKAALAFGNWSEVSTSPTSNGLGTEIFARHASNDGYYWEVGAVVTSANPSLSPALSGGSVAPTSTVVLRIFEVDDEE